MTLMLQLKKDQLTARKVKDCINTSLLTTLIGEAAMIGKNDGNRDTTDLEIVAVIKKFINNINETLKVKDDDKLKTESAILQSYLPKQIEGEALHALVAEAMVTLDATSMKDLGKVMGYLKSNHAGTYDGGSASKIVKELLNG